MREVKNEAGMASHSSHSASHSSGKEGGATPTVLLGRHSAAPNELSDVRNSSS